MINLKTILTALVAALIASALTFTVLKVTTISTLKQEIKKNELVVAKQFALIDELSKIEKYKIENTFEKIKTKKGSIALELDNNLEAKITDIKNTNDSTEVKKSFWKKIFN